MPDVQTRIVEFLNDPEAQKWLLLGSGVLLVAIMMGTAKLVKHISAEMKKRAAKRAEHRRLEREDIVNNMVRITDLEAHVESILDRVSASEEKIHSFSGFMNYVNNSLADTAEMDVPSSANLDAQDYSTAQMLATELLLELARGICESYSGDSATDTLIESMGHSIHDVHGQLASALSDCAEGSNLVPYVITLSDCHAVIDGSFVTDGTSCIDADDNFFKVVHSTGGLMRDYPTKAMLVPLGSNQGRPVCATD